MNFLKRLIKHEPSPAEELRRGANVIADAVTAARDQEIEEARIKLAAARERARQSRGKVNLAIRAAGEVRRSASAAVSALDSVVEPTMRRITGND
jgi:hypothetical protein